MGIDKGMCIYIYMYVNIDIDTKIYIYKYRYRYRYNHIATISWLSRLLIGFYGASEVLLGFSGFFWRMGPAGFPQGLAGYCS